jgi:hypothetical protein
VRWPLVTAVLGLGAAYAPVFLGLGDLPAFVPFVLLAGAAAGAWVLWSEGGGGKRALVAAALTLPLLGHGYWFFVYSTYPEARGVPAWGAVAPPIAATRVKDGATFDLRAQRGQSAVLVFFRGAW